MKEKPAENASAPASDRPMADDPLQECRQILKNIQHLARIGSWRYYVPEGRLWWSDELYRIFGIEQGNGDLSMETVLDRIHPDDRENFRSQASRGLAHRSDYRIVLRDGSVKYIHEEVRVEQDAEGKPVRMYGTAQDVTERRQAEESLHRSKEILEKTFSSLDSALFLLNSSNPPVITDCNPAAKRIFGYEREEVLGMTTSFLHVDTEALAEFQKMNYEAIEEQGFLSGFEFRMKRKNGEIFPSEHSVFPLRDDHSVRIGWVSVVKDITERKRVEQDLQKSAEKYTFLVEATNTGYVIIDGWGRVLDANPEYVRMTGHGRLEDILGRPVTEWTAAHDLKRNAAEVRKCMENGSVRNLVIDYVDAEGRITPVEINATVLQQEQPLRIFTICRDITERKQADEALRESKRYLEMIIEAAPT